MRFAVRHIAMSLIGKQQNRTAKRALSAEQRAGDAVGDSFRIRHSARIVRHAHDCQLRARGERTLERDEVGQHRFLIKRNLNQASASTLNKRTIRLAARRKRDHFVFGLEHRAHKRVDGAVDPAGHNDVGSGIGGAETTLQRSGNSRRRAKTFFRELRNEHFLFPS